MALLPLPLQRAAMPFGGKGLLPRPAAPFPPGRRSAGTPMLSVATRCSIIVREASRDAGWQEYVPPENFTPPPRPASFITSALPATAATGIPPPITFA